jgi:hypothetical protein
MVADLAKKEVRHAPELDSAGSAARQVSLGRRGFYGWNVWRAFRRSPGTGPSGVTHLHNIRDVAGYQVRGSDRKIGHVEDFLVEEDGWTIQYMVVETGKWFFGRKVLIAPRWIEKISRPEREVAVNRSREQVRCGPPHDPAAAVKRTYGGSRQGSL